MWQLKKQKKSPEGKEDSWKNKKTGISKKSQKLGKTPEKERYAGIKKQDGKF